MSFSLVGTQWNLPSFETYLSKTNLSWADSVTIHHTGFPNLGMRKKGLLVQHIKNIRDYYQGKGWSAGPHLFIDDLDINGMSPLNERGVHARSYNSHSLGIEILGNYDIEDPKSGRGFNCWTLAAQATAAILNEMGREANAKHILFHRDDPKTRKSCPGNKVNKGWFIDKVKNFMTGEIVHEKDVSQTIDDRSQFLKDVDWQIRSILKENDNIEGDQFKDLEDRLGRIRWQALKRDKDS
jgi:hypothetical protein